MYYVPKNSILLAGIGVWKICSVACGFSSIKIDYSDYSKSLISRINEVYVFSIKYRYSNISLIKKQRNLHFSRLFSCNHTCYCVNMVSVTSASLYINFIMPGTINGLELETRLSHASALTQL